MGFTGSFFSPRNFSGVFRAPYQNHCIFFFGAQHHKTVVHGLGPNFLLQIEIRLNVGNSFAEAVAEPPVRCGRLCKRRTNTPGNLGVDWDNLVDRKSFEG